MVRRDSTILVYEDEHRKAHCRMCHGVLGLVTSDISVCLIYDSCECHCTGSYAEHLTGDFRYDNTKHKILLSSNINKITEKDISSIVNKSIEYIIQTDG